MTTSISINSIRKNLHTNTLNKKEKDDKNDNEKILLIIDCLNRLILIFKKLLSNLKNIENKGNKRKIINKILVKFK